MHYNPMKLNVERCQKHLASLLAALGKSIWALDDQIPVPAWVHGLDCRDKQALSMLPNHGDPIAHSYWFNAREVHVSQWLSEPDGRFPEETPFENLF